MVLVFGWGIISRQRTGVLGEAAHGYKQPEQMHRVLDNPEESSESVSGIQWKTTTAMWKSLAAVENGLLPKLEQRCK